MTKTRRKTRTTTSKKASSSTKSKRKPRAKSAAAKKSSAETRVLQARIKTLKDACANYKKYLKTQPDVKMISTNEHAYQALESLSKTLTSRNIAKDKLASFIAVYHQYAATFTLNINRNHNNHAREFLDAIYDALPTLKMKTHSFHQLANVNNFRGPHFNPKGFPASRSSYTLKILGGRGK